MTESRDERLGRLTEAVEAAIERGEDPDVLRLARDFEVEEAEAARIVATVRSILYAVENGLENMPEDLPQPALPEDYEIEGELGRGGMGVVYRALQKSLGRAVAVKVVRPASLGFADAVRRFTREARSLARLEHPGIISVHDAGVAGDAVWYSMDLASGGSLADRLKQGRLHPGEAVRILLEVAGAIAYSHEHGIIHRDLKPANVLLDEEGNAFVADFGLARDVALSLDASGSSRVLGTPGYMAPEQARGDLDAIGERTDVYALGVLLYECLTGSAPFAGRGLVETMRAVVSEEPRNVRRGNPHVPRDLAAIVGKAMAKRPQRRYVTARAFLEDLLAFASGKPVQARRPGRIAAGGRFLVRHRVPLLGGLAGALLAGMLIVLVLVPRLGRSPETLASLADELLEKGEASAAVTLYQEASRRHRFAGSLFPDPNRDRFSDPADPLAYRIETGLADASTAVARQRILAGDLKGANKLLCEVERRTDRAFGKVGWPGKAEERWERVLVLCLLGRHAEADQRFSDLGKWLRDRASVRESRRRHVPWRPWNYAANQLVPLVVRDLLAQGPAARKTAGRYALYLLSPTLLGEPLLQERLLAMGSAALPGLMEIVAPSSRPASAALWYSDGLVLSFARSGLRAALQTSLAKVVEDPARSAEGRSHALSCLLRIADLPAVEAPYLGREKPVFDESKARERLELWRKTKDLPLGKALPIEVRFAIDHPGEGTRRWFRTHTGSRAGKPEELRAWWKENGHRPVREWLADSVGLGGRSPTRKLVLDRLRNTSDKSVRYRLHLLLSILAPKGVHRPFVLPGETDRLVGLWRAALSAAPAHGPWVVRAAGFVVGDAGPPEIRWQIVRKLPIGEPLPIDEVSLRVPELTAGIRLPGTRLGKSEPSPLRGRFRSGLILDWREKGLTLEVASRVASVAAWGGSWSRSGKNVPAGLILPFDSLESYSGSGDGRVVNHFALAVAEPPGSADRSWTVRDWRKKVAGNLAFLLTRATTGSVAERSSFGYRYQQGFYLVPRIAAKLGVPLAKAALAGLAALDAGGAPHLGVPVPRVPAPGAFPISFVDEFFEVARLRAGDPAPLADPGIRAELVARLAGDDFHSGWRAVRLLLERPEPAIRSFAFDVLKKTTLRPRVAARIESAIEQGRISVPDWLREKVSGSRRRAALDLVETVAVPVSVGSLVVLLALLALPFALWPRRTRVARLPAAALLVLAGTGILSLDLFVNGTNLLPDVAGAAVALLGVLLFRGQSGRRPFATLLGGFSLALLCAGFMAAGMRSAVLPGVGGFSVYVALAALPWFGGSVDPRGAARPARLYHLLYTLPLGLLWAVSVVVAVRGQDLTFRTGSWGVLYFVVAFALLLAAHLRLLGAARARKKAAAVSAASP